MQNRNSFINCLGYCDYYKNKCGANIFQGMSLAKWLTDLNVDNTTNPLPDHLQSLLLEDHGIANMMKEVQCSRTTDANYTSTNTTVDGWNVSKWDALI